MIYTKDELQNIYNQGIKNKIQQRKPEWFSFMEILNNKNKFNVILEIGAYDGGTSITLSYFTNKLITIDGNVPCRFNQNEIKKQCEFIYLGCDSLKEETKEQVSFLTKKVDVLVIDGNHTYEGSMKDYTLYKDLVIPGGIIAFHDIVDSEYHRNCNCYVSKTWNEVKSLHSSFTELVFDNAGNKYNLHNITNKDVCWGGIGVIFVD